MKKIVQSLPYLWFWMFFLILALAGGFTYYRVENDRIRKDKYQEIASIAKLKARQITQWRWERIADATTTAKSPYFKSSVAEWLRNPGALALRADLEERLKLIKKAYAYADVLLTDTTGRVLLSTLPEPEPLQVEEKRALEEAVAGRKAVLSDLFRSPKSKVYLDAMEPVLSPEGVPLAAVFLKSDADTFLYPIIRYWPIPIASAETFLVRRDGNDVLFLNDLVTDPMPPFPCAAP